MKINTKNLPIRLIATAVVLLLLIVFMMVAHATLGRYTSFINGNLSFAPSSKNTFVLDTGEWSANGQETTLSLHVTKAETAKNAGAVGIRVYIPSTDAAIPKLVLTCDGASYEASVKPIPEGTAAHKTYGAGQMCCFYAQNNEVSFEIPDDAGESLNMTLVLASDKTDTSGFQVIVEPVNTENGGDR